MGASDFMDRMEWLDREVSKKLTYQLESEVSRASSAGTSHIPAGRLGLGVEAQNG